MIHLNESELKFLILTIEQASLSLANKLHSAIKPVVNTVTATPEMQPSTIRLTKSGRPAKKPGRKPGKKYPRKTV